MLRKHVRNGELVVPPGQYFVMGDNRGPFRRQPLLGLRAAREHHRQALVDLLVLRRSYGAAARFQPRAFS